METCCRMYVEKYFDEVRVELLEIILLNQNVEFRKSNRLNRYARDYHDTNIDPATHFRMIARGSETGFAGGFQGGGISTCRALRVEQNLDESC